MNPDGTNQAVYFGNMHPGDVYIDAKPIPDSNQVLFIHSPGHGRKDHGGRIATVSDDNGPDDLSAIRFITPDNIQYWDPFPLGNELLLAGHKNKLVLLDMEGNKSVLYSQPQIPAGPEGKLAGVGLHEPRPLIKRSREPMIPDRTNPEEKTGRMILTDVYNGRNMKGVEKGSIKKLLILESLPKPINYTGGMDPLTYGGSFTLERIMGTVPVEEDGSAFFELPANRAFFFIALDENDNSVKRMRSFTTVMPGETLSCVGCHEERDSTPTNFRPDNFLTATRRPASKIEKVPEIPDVFDFPRDIQPILDRHCVECHQPARREGGVLLTGDHGPMYSHSYFTLTIQREFADGRNEEGGNTDPYKIGAVASPLMKKLDGSHHGVVVPEYEAKLIHYWIEAGAPYPGTYAALGCGAIGGYSRNQQTINSDLEWPETPVATAAIENRCAGCHAGDRSLPKSLQDENQLSFWKMTMLEPQIPQSRHIVFNLSLPEQSLMLLGPLSKKAGGYGACREMLPDGSVGEPVVVFKDTNDPDYQSILALIEAGKTKLAEVKRFDMPGFHPPQPYLREMQTFGVLPPDFDPDADFVDAYALDRQYWDLFEYVPD
jgi:mono/diheme cytochrome c family protein